WEHHDDDAYWAVKYLGRTYYKLTPWQGAFVVADRAARRARSGGRGGEEAAQAGLLRCIFGSPFRPVTLGPDCVTPQVVALALAAYDERTLPTGELCPERLAVLADALEEAGAPDGVVGHLRGRGPHVRGCFVVDQLLQIK